MDWTGFCLVCGARGAADVIANVILFLPLGAAAAYGGWPVVRTLLAGALFSSCIEVAQIGLVAGRDANVGDLIANTLGSFAGWWLFRRHPWRWVGRFSTVPSAGVAAAATALLVSGVLLLRPDFPPGPYRVGWTPVYENHAVYQGQVLSAALSAGESTPEATLRDGALVSAVEGGTIRIRFTAGPAPERLAPILALHQGEREVQMIGAYGHDLVYRYWATADALRLDHADLRIPDALADVAPGDTVSLAFSHTSTGLCLTMAVGRCGRALTAGDTWSLLVSPDMAHGRRVALGLAWLLVVFLPAGLIARDGRAAAGAGAVAALLLIVLPLAAELSPFPWWEVLAACMGVAAGRLAAASIQRTEGIGPRSLIRRRRRVPTPA